VNRQFLVASATSLFALLIGCRAGAQALVQVGTGITFEYAADGRSVETKQPVYLSAGYRLEVVDTFLEYSQFHDESGLPLISVARTHSELLLWGRKTFCIDWKFRPFTALAVGLQKDDLRTSFEGGNRKTKGSPEGLLAAAVGVLTEVYPGLELDLEGRLETSAHFAPNPEPNLSLHLGWQI
jgi:hypothetical protein